VAYRYFVAELEDCHDARARTRGRRTGPGQAAAAQGQDEARGRHGRRRRGERGGRRGHRGRAARVRRQAHRRGIGRGQHFRERHVGVLVRVVVLVVLVVRDQVVIGVVADRDLRVGTGHLGSVMMAGAGAAGQDGWFTTTVRPAGPLDHAALARLSETLGVLEPSSDMVVIDLTAADVRDPRSLARHLLAPARRFDQAGRCLLLVGASPRLMAELNRAVVPVVTVTAEALHRAAA
jgi:anti-anti-sigma regulatory factor